MLRRLGAEATFSWVRNVESGHVRAVPGRAAAYADRRGDARGAARAGRAAGSGGLRRSGQLPRRPRRRTRRGGQPRRAEPGRRRGPPGRLCLDGHHAAAGRRPHVHGRPGRGDAGARPRRRRPHQRELGVRVPGVRRRRGRRGTGAQLPHRAGGAPARTTCQRCASAAAVLRSGAGSRAGAPTRARTDAAARAAAGADPRGGGGAPRGRGGSGRRLAAAGRRRPAEQQRLLGPADHLAPDLADHLAPDTPTTSPPTTAPTTQPTTEPPPPPTPVVTTVQYTCGASGTGDCFLSERAGPGWRIG